MTSPATAREADVEPRLLRLAYERILKRVEFDPNGGCWLWPGAMAGSYGMIRIRPHVSLFAVHRVSHWVEKGPIPDGLHGCHSCDVRLCGNPSHVYAGTQSDNLQDALRKGRLYLPKRNRELVGELHSNATLTNRDVEAIRLLHANGFDVPYLAQRFGASEGNLFKIVGRRVRRGG